MGVRGCEASTDHSVSALGSSTGTSMGMSGICIVAVGGGVLNGGRVEDERIEGGQGYAQYSRPIRKKYAL
jgi:hypothetical protein